MDSDSKKMFKFGLFILLIAIFAIGFFIWGFIAKGTLVLSGEAPFSVRIVDGKVIECQTSPCEISLGTGNHSAFISKSNYKDLFIESKIRLWKSTDINLSFQLLPSLIETDNLPSLSKSKNYGFEVDNNGQKLVDTDDASSNAIVYFPKQLKEPKVFANGDYALVLGGNAYKVNTKANTREEIPVNSLIDISDAKWSMDGRYLIFSKKDALNLWLLDSKSGTSSQLDVSAPLKLAQWLYDDTLVFVTGQEYSSKGGFDSFGNGYTELLNTYSSQNFTVGFFYPNDASYSRLESFQKQMPEDLIAMANGESIYLKIGEKNFRIILRKF